MPLTLEADGGKLIATIPMPKGKPARYLVESCEKEMSRWARRLTKLGDKSSRPYRVWLDDFGWHCGCPDMSEKYGRARKFGYDCKHIHCAAELAALEGIFVAAKEKVTATVEPADPQTGPLVYRAIARVQAAIAGPGIAKTHDLGGVSGKAKFRGIDDVYNALANLLVSAGLCILPRVTARQQLERTAKGGGAIYYTAVTVEFDFIAVADGSKHTVVTVGEAMDSSDKSTNKAMSAAYKYACFQAFCIPTLGDNDADATTPEAIPQQQTTPPQKPATNGKATPTAIKTLEDGVREYDAVLTRQGLCKAGELLAYVAESLLMAHGLPATWGPASADAAREVTRHFEAMHREAQAASPAA